MRNRDAPVEVGEGQYRQPKPAAGLVGVDGPQLDGKLMGPRVAVADQFLCARIEVLLAVADALAECRRHRGIQNPDAPAGTNRDLNAVKARRDILIAGTNDLNDLAQPPFFKRPRTATIFHGVTRNR